MSEKVVCGMIEKGEAPDFVCCIGDDRSDEDMFESIMNMIPNTNTNTNTNSRCGEGVEIFACTVGRKPSKAKYYLDDTVDVVRLLSGLANASDPKPSSNPASFQVTFDAVF